MTRFVKHDTWTDVMARVDSAGSGGISDVLPGITVDPIGSLSLTSGTGATVNNLDAIANTDEDMFSLVDNTTIVCASEGMYLVVANFSFAGNTSGIRAGWIYVDGTEEAGRQAPPFPSEFIDSQVSVSYLRHLPDVDQAFSFVAYQNSGGNLDLTNSSSFGVVKLS